MRSSQVMNSILGPAPITDFDGTLARLDVPWDGLRAQLGVTRIADLWHDHALERWTQVSHAEERAAQIADAVPEMQSALAHTKSFAVLSSNSESAVWRFLERFADLGSRVRAVVGRETLDGPKDDFEVFARGFTMCAEATATARSESSIIYVGDMPYELAFARRLGARTVHIDALLGGGESNDSD
jgi:phosphoglycolate phosphatase-like HAD superfamily hydrolase